MFDKFSLDYNIKKNKLNKNGLFSDFINNSCIKVSYTKKEKICAKNSVGKRIFFTPAQKVYTGRLGTPVTNSRSASECQSRITTTE